jgi:hypothetical protein
MKLNPENEVLAFRRNIGAAEKAKLAALAASLNTDITTMVAAWITRTLKAKDGREQFIAALTEYAGK